MNQMLPRPSLHPALTEGDLADKLTPERRNTLLCLAVSRLSLYGREISATYHAELLANVGNWRAGYNREDDYYWVVPVSEEGFYIRGIGGGTCVFKWEGWEFEVLVPAFERRAQQDAAHAAAT